MFVLCKFKVITYICAPIKKQTINTSTKAHILLLLSTVLGSANYSILKTLVPQYLAPDAVVMSRLLLGFLFFSLCTFPKIGFKGISKSDWKILFMCALFGVVGNQYFFYHGMSRTLPINGSIFNLSLPVTIWLLNAVIHKKKVTIIASIGFILSALGAIFMLDFSAVRFSNETFVGDIMVWINAVSFGIYVVLVAPLTQRIDAMKISQIIFGIGLILYLPIGLLPFIEADWQHLESEQWLSFSYIIIATTFIIYYLNNLIPKIAPTHVIALYVYLQPIVVAVIAVMFRGDSLGIKAIVCALITMCGIYLAQNDQDLLNRWYGK